MTIETIRSALLSSPRVVAVGGRTKPALSQRPGDVLALKMSGYAGLTEYDPSEFTFTARAGTRLRDLINALAAHGQYLPFDPPLINEGATLGGTIAAGLNGPGRLRFGGLRDFILGLVFLTSAGQLVRGGGKVVKNAAGFDFPKLLVGSCGEMGVILEATFKVFPAPRATLTAETTCATLEKALALMALLGRLPADLDALELEPPGRVIIRLAGDEGTLAPRLARLAADCAAPFQEMDTPPWAAYASDLGIRVPINIGVIPYLEVALSSLGMQRRYSVAGNLAIIHGEPERLTPTLHAYNLAGLSLKDPPAKLGYWPHAAESLLRPVFDPAQRFSA